MKKNYSWFSDWYFQKPKSFVLKLFMLFILFGISKTSFAQCVMPEVDGELNACINNPYQYRVTNIPLPFNPSQSYSWSLSGGGIFEPGFPSPVGEIKSIRWIQAGTWTVNVSLSGCGIVKAFTVNVSNTPAPAAPSAITGNTTACLNEAKTYSVTPVAGITYDWKIKQSTVPFAVVSSIPISVSGNQATVTWNLAGSYQLYVSASNGSCVSPASSNLGVGVGIPSQPMVYYNNQVCVSSSANYQVNNAFQGATFTWTHTGDGSITSAGTMATVNFGATPGTSTISVTASNTCGTSTPYAFNVSRLALGPKPTIGGPPATCVNTPTVFTVSPNQSSDWVVTPNANFTRSGNTFTFTQPGTYEVRARVWYYPCYGELSDPKTIVVNSPTTPPVISGNTMFCENSINTLTVSNPVAGITYTWMASPGFLSINGMNGPIPVSGNSVTVSSTMAGSYSLTVSALQPEGCVGSSAPPVVVPIIVHTPLTTGNVSEILGSSSVCQDAYPYKINNQPYPVMVTGWTLSGGGSLASPTGQSNQVTWSGPPGNYTLTANTSNACGAGPTRQLVVNVHAGLSPPNQPVSGLSPVCLNNTESYTTVDNPSMNYIWTSTGQVMTSLRNTASIKWTLPSAISAQSVTVQTNNGTCDSRPVTYPVNVLLPATQSYFFSPPAFKNYGELPFALLATSNSGLPFTYTSSNTTVATVSGNMVTIVGAGTTTITASNAGSNCFQPLSVSKSLVVNKVGLMVTAANKTKIYGDVNPTLTISFAGFVNGDNASVLDTPPTVSTTATQFSAAGTYAITPSTGSDNNYTITPVDGTLTIEKAPLVISAFAVRDYGDTNPPLLLTYSSFKGTETSAVIDVLPVPSTTATQFSNAGTYPITLAGGSDNNYAITTVTGVFTVNKAPLTATADNKSKIYGDANPTLTIAYSGFKGTETSTVIDTPPTVSTTATQFSNAGTYSIIPSGGTDNNYAFTYVNGVLTVNKAILIATAENKTKNFGQVNPAFTILYTGFKGTETSVVLDTSPVVSTTAVQCSPVGTISLTPSGGADNNYSFSFVNGSLSIQKAIVTFAAENKTRIYGSTNPAFTFTISGVVCSDNVNSLPSGTSASACSAAFTYPITLSGASDPNYDFVYTSATLTVTKATLTATAANQTRTYGGSNALQYSYSGFVCSDNGSMVDSQPVISTTGSSCSPPGAYPITLAGGMDNNYSIALVNGTLQINKAPLTVSAPALNMTYGNTIPAVTLSYSGFVCSDNSSGIDSPPSSSTGASNCSDTGTYPITLTGGSDDRYTFTRQSGSLTISQRPLTVTADNQSHIYGGDRPTLTYSYSGFVCGDGPGVIYYSPTAFTETGSCSPAGDYPIYINGGSHNNYSFNYINGTLSIGKSMLTARAENQSRPYGSEDPAFTISYSGFHCGENPAQLDSPPVAYSPATLWSNTGDYPIMLGGGSDNNYTFSPIGGTLTIHKAAQEITFPSIPIQCGGTVITLEATASSGLPITYSSSNTYIATISGSDASLNGEGSTTITANQDGDGNYNPASHVSRTFFVGANWGEISPRSGDLNLCGSASLILDAGDGYNHYWNTTSYSQSITVHETGTYTVSYTTYYGCNVSASVEVYRGWPCTNFRTKDSNLDSVQPEEPGVSELSAFPNPASDRLTIAMPFKMKTETPVILYDRFGKQMITGEIKGGESQTELAVNELTNGVYIVRVGKGALLNTRKITILHHGN